MVPTTRITDHIYEINLNNKKKKFEKFAKNNF